MDLSQNNQLQPVKNFQLMSNKSLFVTILGILVVAGGLGAGLILVQRQQDIREKAATEGDRQCVTAYNCLDKKTKCCPGLVEINDKSCDRKDEQKRQIRCVPNIGDGGGGTPTPPPGGGGGRGAICTWCTSRSECLSVGGTVDLPEGNSYCSDRTHVTCCAGTGGGGGAGGSEVGQTPTPTPTPPLTAECTAILIYDQNWQRIKNFSNNPLQPGMQIYITIHGRTNMGYFEKAKFKINKQVTQPTSEKRNGRFYIQYEVPNNVTELVIDANLKHSDIGWLEDW